MLKVIQRIARFIPFAVLIAIPLNAQSSAHKSTKSSNTKEAKMMIEMSFGGDLGAQEVRAIIELEDNPATRDFYAQLPLNLEFSDYVGKEKISNALPKPLNTSGLNGYEPQIGDLFYFAPWGNLGIFYAKQPFHSGLVRLGCVDTQTLTTLKSQKRNFVIRFTKATK